MHFFLKLRRRIVISRNLIIFALVLFIAVGVAIFLLSSNSARTPFNVVVSSKLRQVPTGTITSDAVVAEIAGSSATVNASTAAIVQLQAVQLPAPASRLSAPLSFDDLAYRADRGDAHAACQLLAVIQVCSKPVDVEAFKDTVVRYLIDEVPDSANQRALVDRLVRLEAFEPRRQKLCANISTEQLVQFEQRLSQAAHLGVPWAALEYFLNPGALRSADGELDKHRVAEYRQDAVMLLERAAQGGNVDALRWLFWIYSNGRYSADSVALEVPVDHARAVAVGIELMAIVNTFDVERVSQELKPIQAQLTSQDWARVGALGATYRVPRSAWDLESSQDADQQIEHCGD